MPVYAKKLSPEWAKAFKEFEQMSGFEMMYQHEVDDGTMTPKEAWQANLDWLHSHISDVMHISVPHEF